MKISLEEMKTRREATEAYPERTEARTGQKQTKTEIKPDVEEMNATDLEPNQEEIEVVS
jgi:hypothetical protein